MIREINMTLLTEEQQGELILYLQRHRHLENAIVADKKALRAKFGPLQYQIRFKYGIGHDDQSNTEFIAQILALEEFRKTQQVPSTKGDHGSSDQ